MPTINFTVERAGYAEQFIANFHKNMPEKLTAIITELKDEIVFNAPSGHGETRPDPRSGGMRLAESFYVVPAQQTDEGWEATINSRLPVRARVHEFGSGYWGPGASWYPITPKNARFLKFDKEGVTKFLKLVKHPGVHPQMYIRSSIAGMRDRIREAFGEAIRMSAIDVGGVPRGPGYP